MRKVFPLQFVALLMLVCVTVPSTLAAPLRDQAAVRAVLFYSPACPHCHQVINEVLMPMVEEYGDQLQIVGIDTSQPSGSQLYQATVERFQVPPERRGVPTLVVGDVVLVGSVEIPGQFPTLFEEGLAAGGIDWPDIPGLAEMLSQAEATPSPTGAPPPTDTPVNASAIMPTATPRPSATVAPQTTNTPHPSATTTPQASAPPRPSSTATPAPSILVVGEDEIVLGEAQEPSPDPLGSTLAGTVLVGMVFACGYAVRRVTLARRELLRFNDAPLPAAKTWAIPLLAGVGLIVAAYLSYVEVKHVEAVCGPVGECNIVQNSEYALLLGIPIAVWGVMNYIAVAALWVGGRYLNQRWANLATLGLLGLTLFGVFFSIYLTCLELFFIHAICAWCLTSALVTTLLMLLVVVPLTGGPSWGKARH
ncbi:MAG: vitamin K epoxide reductase family protein [Anaerolineae bacterium]|jgi:uncharacterized membrane protein